MRIGQRVYDTRNPSVKGELLSSVGTRWTVRWDTGERRIVHPQFLRQMKKHGDRRPRQRRLPTLVEPAEKHGVTLARMQEIKRLADANGLTIEDAIDAVLE